MNLRDLLNGVTAEPMSEVAVAGIACHSKQVRQGDVFVAIEGAATDGHAFIEEALARGAAAVVAQRPPLWARPAGVKTATHRAYPHITVRDSRQALVVMASRFYGHPSRKLRLIGVTGTNGKTTTTYLIKSILETSGAPAGLLGTIVYQIGERVVPSTNTTPGPLELQRYFAQMVGEGLKWCAMEVSSHALAQGRIEGLEFEGAIFTNLGSDHLDYHKTRDAYARAKRRLFDYLRPEGHAVINTDDDYGRELAETLPQRCVAGVGMERPAKVMAKQISCTWEGTHFILESPWGTIPIDTPLLGRHNVWNMAQASTILMSLGIAPLTIRQGLASVESVPGRLERVPNEAGIQVVVDYAHTADALRLALLSLRELTRGRLIVVFGCGGDRDQTKRPVMGKTASLLADRVILTSDNPRTEDPMDIIHQIKSGFTENFQSFDVVADREQAIVSALSIAHRDDTVLIAGKGHESYQIFNHISVPFSDREVVERWTHSHQSVAVAG